MLPDGWRNTLIRRFPIALPDDAFWAAKQVMAFTDEQIRAIVKTGQYSDPRAEKYIADHLIVRPRQDRQGFLLASCCRSISSLLRMGRLVFEDLEVKHGFIDAREYSIQWSSFNNETEEKTALSGETSLAVPRQVSSGDYIAAEIRSGNSDKTVTVYLRNQDGKMKVVGIERTW